MTSTLRSSRGFPAPFRTSLLSVSRKFTHTTRSMNLSTSKASWKRRVTTSPQTISIGEPRTTKENMASIMVMQSTTMTALIHSYNGRTVLPVLTRSDVRTRTTWTLARTRTRIQARARIRTQDQTVTRAWTPVHRGTKPSTSTSRKNCAHPSHEARARRTRISCPWSQISRACLFGTQRTSSATQSARKITLKLHRISPSRSSCRYCRHQRR